MSLWVKICGVTSVEDARAAQQAGADAIGLNFAPSSPRCLTAERARAIADEVRGRVEIVGVVVDAPLHEVVQLVGDVGLDVVQLHGNETPEFLQELSQRASAYKAVRIGSSADAATARLYGAERILTDAKVAGAMGGTGKTFDWSLIEGLNRERQLILAGGLNAKNVEDAVRQLRPYGVDTASGVESEPGKKDPDQVVAFITAARRGAGA